MCIYMRVNLIVSQHMKHDNVHDCASKEVSLSSLEVVTAGFENINTSNRSTRL